MRIHTCSRAIRTYIQMLKYILHSDREVATYVITFVYYFLQNIFCIFMDLHICVHISGIKAYLYMIRILYASSGYDVPSISMNPAFFHRRPGSFLPIFVTCCDIASRLCSTTCVHYYTVIANFLSLCFFFFRKGWIAICNL